MTLKDHVVEQSFQVADAMGNFCLWNRCDFIISVGDNMYTTGVDGPFDEKFAEKWKNVYTHPSIAQEWSSWHVGAPGQRAGQGRRQ